jgi:hypothetical protein
MVSPPRKAIPWMESSKSFDKKYSHIICADIESESTRTNVFNALSHLVNSLIIYFSERIFKCKNIIDSDE